MYMTAMYVLCILHSDSVMCTCLAVRDADLVDCCLTVDSIEVARVMAFVLLKEQHRFRDFFCTFHVQVAP